MRIDALLKKNSFQFRRSFTLFLSLFNVSYWLKKVKEKNSTTKRYNLERFVIAQNHETRGYLNALEEIKSGLKKEHWIWYIFPQEKGKGVTFNSEFYGLEGQEEAKVYFNHSLLGQRLLEITRVLAKQGNKDAFVIFDRDAKKVRSCMELFASIDESEEQLFKQVLADFKF